MSHVNPQVEQSQADSHRVVGAFVTFKDESGKLACLKAQPHSRMRQWWSLKQQHKLRGRYGMPWQCMLSLRAGGCCETVQCTWALLAASAIIESGTLHLAQASGPSRLLHACLSFTAVERKEWDGFFALSKRHTADTPVLYSVKLACAVHG
jgi:hypothetical protein